MGIDFLQQVARYDRRYTLDDVVVSYVRDHASGQWVDARSAFFVHGSAAIGPMRKADLPAFAGEQDFSHGNTSASLKSKPA